MRHRVPKRLTKLRGETSGKTRPQAKLGSDGSGIKSAEPPRSRKVPAGEAVDVDPDVTAKVLAGDRNHAVAVGEVERIGVDLSRGGRQRGPRRAAAVG